MTYLGHEKQEAGVIAADGAKLFGVSYLRPKARGTVVLVHGVAEHSGRYRHVVEFLVEAGYSALTFDLRGHGLSPGTRAYLQDINTWVHDLEPVVQKAVGLSEGRPIFLLGHGAGAGVAALYASRMRVPSQLRGLILSSPHMESARYPLLAKVSTLMNFLLPRVGVFHPPTPELLSRDPHVRDHASKDPLNYRGRLTARTLAELALGGRDLRRQMAKIDIPTLILHGTADRIAKSGDSEKLYESVSCRDKTYLTYHGYFHEILNDYGKEVVLEDICSWLHQRAPVF